MRIRSFDRFEEGIGEIAVAQNVHYTQKHGQHREHAQREKEQRNEHEDVDTKWKQRIVSIRQISDVIATAEGDVGFEDIYNGQQPRHHQMDGIEGEMEGVLTSHCNMTRIRG